MRRARCVFLWFALMVILLPAPADAQSVETRTVKLSGPVATNQLATALTNDDQTDSLDRSFLEGKVSDARTRAQALMCKVQVPEWKCNGDTVVPDDTKVFVVVWASKDIAGALTLRRMLLQQTGDRPYALDLQGIGTAESHIRLYEVFLTDDFHATLVSSYKSTRVENPLVGQLPAAVVQILSPLFSIAGAVLEAKPHAPLEANVVVKPPTVWITVSTCHLAVCASEHRRDESSAACNHRARAVQGRRGPDEPGKV